MFVGSIFHRHSSRSTYPRRPIQGGDAIIIYNSCYVGIGIVIVVYRYIIICNNIIFHITTRQMSIYIYKHPSRTAECSNITASYILYYRGKYLYRGNLTDLYTFFFSFCFTCIIILYRCLIILTYISKLIFI